MRKINISARTKRLAILLVLLFTISLFLYFFITKPILRHTLRNLDFRTLLFLLLLYAVYILSLSVVYNATLRMCGKTLKWKENILLTAYSTIVNFFGPLQSGPGVRAAYLKKRHDIRVRDYTVASLIYYAVFATISACFLFVGSVAWWFATLAIGAVIFGCSIIIAFAVKRAKRGDGLKLNISVSILTKLILSTIVQLAIVAIIYFVELHTVHAHASIRQAIIYCGAANFALFVSLTPGAIGFRESFLLFSRRLHHIATTSILAASIVDRAIYLVFLGLLFILVIGVHAKDYLHLRSNQLQNSDVD